MEEVQGTGMTEPKVEPEQDAPPPELEIEVDYTPVAPEDAPPAPAPHKAVPPPGPPGPGMSMQDFVSAQSQFASSQQAQVQDIGAARTMEKLSQNVYNTIQIFQKYLDMYHGDLGKPGVASCVRRLSKGFEFEGWKVTKIPNLRDVHDSRYLRENDNFEVQLDLDLDQCRRFIEWVFDTHHVCDDSQMNMIAPYVKTTLMVLMAVERTWCGSVNFETRNSEALIGTRHMLEGRVFRLRQQNYLQIMEWLAKYPETFDQFDVKPPGDLDKQKKELEETRKKKVTEQVELRKKMNEELQKQLDENQKPKMVDLQRRAKAEARARKKKKEKKPDGKKKKPKKPKKLDGKPKKKEKQ